MHCPHPFLEQLIERKRLRFDFDYNDNSEPAESSGDESTIDCGDKFVVDQKLYEVLKVKFGDYISANCVYDPATMHGRGEVGHTRVFRDLQQIRNLIDKRTFV